MTRAEVWLLQRQGYEHRVRAPFNDLQAETSLWQRAMGERNDFTEYQCAPMACASTSWIAHRISRCWNLL